MPMFDAAAGMAVETEATRPRIPRAATSAVLAFPNAADRRLSPTEPSSPHAGQSQPYNVGRFRRLVRRITQVREEGVSSRSRSGDGRLAVGPLPLCRISTLNVNVELLPGFRGCRRRGADHPSVM